MLVIDLLYILSFDEYENILVHFEDIDVTEMIPFSCLGKYSDCVVINLSYDSKKTFVLNLRCL